MAGRRRLRSAPNLLTGAACYQRTVDGASGTLVLVPSRVMRSWLSILAGLLAGLLVAGALLVGFVFVGPDPVRATPSPSGSDRGREPGRLGVAGRRRRRSPSAIGAAPSGSPGGSAVTENFHVGEPAPALLVPQVGGGTIDLSALRGNAGLGELHADGLPAVHRRVPADERLRRALRGGRARDHRRRHPRGRGRRRGVRVQPQRDVPARAGQRRRGAARVGRVRAAGPLLDRSRGDRPGRRAGRDRGRRDGPRRAVDPAGRRGHARASSRRRLSSADRGRGLADDPDRSARGRTRAGSSAPSRPPARSTAAGRGAAARPRSSARA